MELSSQKKTLNYEVEIFLCSATLVLLITTLFSSCSKSSQEETIFLLPKPVISNIDTSSNNLIYDLIVDWDYAQNKKVSEFVVQLSYDEDFSNIAMSEIVDGKLRTHQFKNVRVVNHYYVRVRALSKNVTLSSDFATGVLNIYIPLAPLSNK